MSQRNVTIEVLFEKTSQQKLVSRSTRGRVKTPGRFTYEREGKRARLPEIGLSLFKASAAAWWTTKQTSSVRGRSSPFLSSSSPRAIRRPTRMIMSRKMEEEEERKEDGKNAFDGASAKNPPNRSSTRDRTRKTVVSVRCYRKIKLRLIVCYIFVN